MRFGAPPDAIAWAALVAALAVAFAFPRCVTTARGRILAIAAAAATSSALSWGYVVTYLRGGPRIVDATTYLLEARAMSHGLLAWEPAPPVASVAGRFLVRDVLGDGARLAGIFPPGYPAWLAAFVKLGAPMASGPVLAALITLATAWLAHEMRARLQAAAPSPEERASLEGLPASAAWLSATCAALRYHTADTMSHGLATLLATVALAGVLRSLSSPRRAVHLVVGASLGALVATRPISGVAIGIVCASVLGAGASGRAERVLRAAPWVALGMLPGLVLLTLHQHAATGAWLTSSQSLYYATSDGPAGCFRYGFGAGIGCEHEHGTFVAANLPEGYGAYAAAATSLRRLKAHLVNPLSSEPAFLLVVAGLASALRAPRAPRLVALAPLALLLGYAPFYFDGNYPGGGARFLAEALPVEHVLALLGARAIASRIRPAWAANHAGLAGVLVAASLAGFAVRASYDHLLLRDREGGRPMFEPRVLAAAGVERGLVFVDTDHGFSIGHDPAISARDGVEVVRRRGDALDGLAWEARGRPPSWAYELSTLADGARADARVVPFRPPPSSVIEGEHLWPAVGQSGAYALPRGAGGTCASGGAWLAIIAPSGSGTIELEVPRSLAGTKLTPRIARAEGVIVEIEMPRGSSMVTRGRAGAASAAEAWSCVETEPVEVDLGDDSPSRLRVRVRASRPPADPRAPLAALDALRLPVSPY